MPEKAKRLSPTNDTKRALLLKSGNQCAYPGCTECLIDDNHKLIAQLCHIEAAEEGGERFNPNQTDEERRHFSNLMYLCYPHHVETNDVDKYPVSVLKKMKADHEEKFAKFGTEISDDLAKAVLDAIPEGLTVEDLKSIANSNHAFVSLEIQSIHDPFYGRDDEISESISILTNNHSKGVIIHGLGGMGKTALSLEIARIFLKNKYFRHILFVSAKVNQLILKQEPYLMGSYNSLNQIIHRIAEDLQATDLIRDKPLLEKFIALGHYFQENLLPNDKCLIILDNLESLSESEQRHLLQGITQWPNCFFLITHRKLPHFAAHFEPQQIGELGYEHAKLIVENVSSYRKHLQEQVSIASPELLGRLYNASNGSPLKLKWILKLVQHKKESLEDVVLLMEQNINTEEHDSFVFEQISNEMTSNQCIVLYALSLFEVVSFDILNKVLQARVEIKELMSSIELLNEFSLLTVNTKERMSLHPLARSLISQSLLSNPNFAIYLKIDVAIAWYGFTQNVLEKEEPLKSDFDMIANEWTHITSAMDLMYRFSKEHDIPYDNEESIYQIYAYDYMFVVMVSLLQEFMLQMGYWDELTNYGNQAYEIATQIDGEDIAELRYQIAYEQAWLNGRNYLNKLSLSENWVNRTVEAANETESRWNKAEATRILGLLNYQQGNNTEGRNLLQESIELYQELSGEYVETDVQLAVARILNDIAQIIFDVDKTDSESKKIWDDALNLYNEYDGSKECKSAIVGNCGDWYYEQDDFESAQECYLKQLNLAQEAGRQDTLASAYWGLAKTCKKQNKFHEALAYSEQAYNIATRLKHNDFDEIESLFLELKEICRIK